MSASKPYPPDSVSPAMSCQAITPTDTTPISPAPCRALWIGVGGDLAVTLQSDAIGAAGTVMKAVPAGTMLPIAAKVVWETGTTASSIVALY